MKESKTPTLDKIGYSDTQIEDIKQKTKNDNKGKNYQISGFTGSFKGIKIS